MNINQAEEDFDDIGENIMFANQVLAASDSPTRSCPLNGDFDGVLPLSQIRRGGAVRLEALDYYHRGELSLKKSVSLLGRGRGQTSITFCVDRYESAIRILASSVMIKNLTINVLLRRVLIKGGSGDFGTGITVGRFLKKGRLERVRDVLIQNVGIHRGNFSESPRIVSYTGGALSILGDVADVDIRGLYISGRHNIGILMHWGGSFSQNCAITGHPYFKNQGTKLKCPIGKTFHPHRISVEDVQVESLIGSLTMLSSVFDVDIQRIRGPVRQAFYILPGDEGTKYIDPRIREKVGTNINISDMLAIIRDGGLKHPIFLGSKGRSKYDQSFTTVNYRNLTFSNIRIQGHKSDRRNFRKIKRGLFANYFIGSNVVFKNIDFFDLGKSATYSIEVLLKYSQGLVFEGLRTQAKNGLLVLNSKNIQVSGGRFVRQNVSATRSNSPYNYYNARGVIIVDEARKGISNGAFPGYLNNIEIKDLEILGYDTGLMAKPLDFPTPFCDRVRTSKISINARRAQIDHNICL